MKRGIHDLLTMYHQLYTVIYAISIRLVKHEIDNLIIIEIAFICAVTGKSVDIFSFVLIDSNSI